MHIYTIFITKLFDMYLIWLLQHSFEKVHLSGNFFPFFPILVELCFEPEGDSMKGWKIQIS